jgi:hypothetical protein
MVSTYIHHQYPGTGDRKDPESLDPRPHRHTYVCIPRRYVDLSPLGCPLRDSTSFPCGEMDVRLGAAGRSARRRRIHNYAIQIMLYVVRTYVVPVTVLYSIISTAYRSNFFLLSTKIIL